MKFTGKFADAYDDLLVALCGAPDFVCTPRGLPCNEMLSGQLKLDPIHCFFENPHRDFSKLIRYLVGETAWYFGGRNDLEFIEQFAPFWKGIANPDGTCNSAYGNLVFRMTDAKADKAIASRSQWQWAYDSLAKDKDTRQAIVHFNRPCHQHDDVKDFPCTVYCNFLIRNNMLYMISRMRSQDVFKGLTYDIPFFSLMLQNMKMLLKTNVYHDLELGGLLHTSDSMHLYKKDEETVRQMLACEFHDITIALPEPLVDERGAPTAFYGKFLEPAAKAHNDAAAATLAYVMLGGQL